MLAICPFASWTGSPRTCRNTWSERPLWWLMNSRETNGAIPPLSVSIALPTRSLLVIAMRSSLDFYSASAPRRRNSATMESWTERAWDSARVASPSVGFRPISRDTWFRLPTPSARPDQRAYPAQPNRPAGGCEGRPGRE